MRRVFIAMILLAASCAYALELPDSVGEWQCVGEHVVPLVLDVNGENLGRMVYRDYERETPKGLVSVILTEGKGTGNLYVPEHLRDAQGVMPSGSEYKLLEISGRAAVLELHEYIPASLAIAVDECTVITIESSALNEETIIDLAKSVITQSKNQ